MKDQIKDTIVDVATSVKGTAITTTGLSAPIWVQYLETIINPVVAFIIALLTIGFMATRFVNGLYEWRENWRKREEEERKRKLIHRESDNDIK